MASARFAAACSGLMVPVVSTGGGPLLVGMAGLSTLVTTIDKEAVGAGWLSVLVGESPSEGCDGTSRLLGGRGSSSGDGEGDSDGRVALDAGRADSEVGLRAGGTSDELVGSGGSERGISDVSGGAKGGDGVLISAEGSGEEKTTED